MMIFKTCKKCGAELGFRAKVCPQCQAKVPKPTTSEQFQLGCMILVLIWFGVVIAGAVFLYVDRPM